MLDGVLSAWDRAWNEPDPAERRRLLDEALTPDAELLDPTVAVRGRDAIAERIGGFGERFPGARVEITSGVDEHHGVARYAWTIYDAGGSSLLDGLDVVERAPDDRLRRVIMFFGSAPAAAD